MNNLSKFLAAFDPTNSCAYPHIISISRTNSNTDICVKYLGANGDSSPQSGIQSCTNVLECAIIASDGSYTTNFISTGQTNILCGGTGLGIVTNMLDPAAPPTSPPASTASESFTRNKAAQKLVRAGKRTHLKICLQTTQVATRKLDTSEIVRT